MKNNVIQDTANKVVSQRPTIGHKYSDRPPELIYLNEKEFAEIIGHTVSSVRGKRIKGKGCHYYKIDGSVRYKLSEILEYIDKGKCSSTTKET